VEVRVVSKELVPGVEDGGEPDGGLEVGAGEFEKGFADGLEEEGEAHLGHAPEERVKLRWNGEDDLEVHRREEQGFLGLGPELLLEDLALGTVPTATGVVGASGEAAIGALLDVTAELFGAAGGDVAYGPGLFLGET
jgi:hypothetical protein